jgi:2,3-bisphosphoglycerate-dependent phosphoglycerate mutase
MTKIYFVRHAQPDYSIHDDLIRPLTIKGIEDTKKVTEFLLDKNINRAFSSPYERSINTIKPFTESIGLEIKIIDAFRERKIDDVWIEDFNAFSKSQWEDFEYKLSNGECLNEVQKRNIIALNDILKENINCNIVVGTHGTALSTIINYYNKDFGYTEFERIKNIMPFIVCIEFEDNSVKNIEEFIL